MDDIDYCYMQGKNTAYQQVRHKLAMLHVQVKYKQCSIF